MIEEYILITDLKVNIVQHLQQSAKSTTTRPGRLQKNCSLFPASCKSQTKIMERFFMLLNSEIWK